MRPRECWATLELDSAVGGMVVQRTGPDGLLGIFAAVTMPQRRRALVIELGLGQADLPSLPRFDALRIQFLAPGKDWGSAFMVELMEPSLATAFDFLTDALHEAAEPENDGIRRAAAIGETLAEWRRMVRRSQRIPLTEERVRGLFAELCFLKDHLAPSIGMAAGLASWEGPRGAAQDFRFGNVALECKAHAGDSTTIRIHGADQLNPQGVRQLFLHVLALDPADEGTTLPDLVSSLQGTMDADSRRRFAERLMVAGYYDDDAEHYDRTYRTGGQGWFLVSPDFPSIQGAPMGVSEVQYSLDFAMAGHDASSRKSFLEAISP